MNSFFLQGLQHPFFIPAHLLALITLALLLGLHKRQRALSSLPFFVVFTLSGLLLTRVYQPDFDVEMVLLGLSAMIGIFIAAKFTFPRSILYFIASIIGIAIGVSSEVIIIPGLKPSVTYLYMFGTLLSVSLTLAFSTLLALIFALFANGIILRILGSWAFASSLMVLAFMFVPKP